MRARTFSIVCALVACGGSNVDIPHDDGGVTKDASAIVDASDAATIDVAVEAGPYGAPSGTYPAFQPWMGQLTKNGGPMLTTPELITITWDGDPGRATFESFADGLGASSYWAAAVGEYGIVGATSNPSVDHVHVTSTPAASWADSDVQAFIQTNLGGLLPANGPQKIYIVYVSPSTSFTFNGQNACGSIGGYHDDFLVAGVPVAYAVLPRCTSVSKVTQFASHEIGEASTDPQPSTSKGLYGFDDPYLAFYEWQRFNVENGDACEFFADSDYTDVTPFAFQVQRLWSNKQGPLGHSPCQPFTAPYFNVAPLALEDITVDLSQGGGPASFKTKGYACALNQSIQIPIGFYSDAATGPWTVTVAESNPLLNPLTGRLTLSVDTNKTSGVNGEKTFINVTVIQKNTINAELLTIISTQGTTKHGTELLARPATRRS